MARHRRLSLGLATIAALALTPALAGAAAQPQSAAQRLVDEYTPMLMLREQEDPPCDTSEEQYQPTRSTRCSATRR